MKNFYIGNLSFSTTEDALRSAFATYGKVEEVNMVRDEGGQPRGFAFVEMENESEAATAISGLNGSSLEGRTINVNEARPKADRAKARSGRDRR
jgi:RNA recognition motif-containing protein